MKISVLVPVFNVEDYLAECIESVIGQSYNNAELILVNDGSTDQSPAICIQYALRYPEQIVVIHTENKGPLHARAKALEKATGDVVVFLDADDCLRNDALEQIAHCFDKHTCDMVLFNTGECERFVTLQVRHTIECGDLFDEDSKKALYKGIILGQIPNSVCLKAIRANCAGIPEHFYQYNVKHGEDLLFSVHFITNCKKIVYLNEGLYYYRKRSGSAVHSFNITQRKESVKIIHTELGKYVASWNMPELRVLHNTRKVKGWIHMLWILLKNGSALSRMEFETQLQSMATDPYFSEAYGDKDATKLSYADRMLAFCLIHKYYYLLLLLSCVLSILKRMKLRR